LFNFSPACCLHSKNPIEIVSGERSGRLALKEIAAWKNASYADLVENCPELLNFHLYTSSTSGWSTTSCTRSNIIVALGVLQLQPVVIQKSFPNRALFYTSFRYICEQMRSKELNRSPIKAPISPELGVFPVANFCSHGRNKNRLESDIVRIYALELSKWFTPSEN
jgi:hypothetical protein